MDRQETRKLEDLTPYDRNPRQNDGRAVDEVLESLKRHGQVKPIVVSAKGHPFEQEIICCGHTTLKALQKFGAKECAVVVHEFKDEAEFVDYNVRDNQSATFSMWDNSKLVELSQNFDLDLQGMGFNVLSITGEEVDGIDAPDLQDGDRAPFQQMTFTLHDSQVETVKAAMAKAKADGNGKSDVNENSNGNALAWIAEAFNNG